MFKGKISSTRLQVFTMIHFLSSTITCRPNPDVQIVSSALLQKPLASTIATVLIFFKYNLWFEHWGRRPCRPSLLGSKRSATCFNGRKLSKEICWPWACMELAWPRQATFVKNFLSRWLVCVVVWLPGRLEPRPIQQISELLNFQPWSALWG